MKSPVRSAIAVAAAGLALAGCASYDYGYHYGQPYDGYYYGYDSGPYSYDHGPYYDGRQWRGNDSRSSAPWPSGPNDPWGGTNKPNDRTSQQ